MSDSTRRPVGKLLRVLVAGGVALAGAPALAADEKPEEKAHEKAHDKKAHEKHEKKKGDEKAAEKKEKEKKEGGGVKGW